MTPSVAAETGARLPLFESFPRLESTTPRIQLGAGPSPVHRLDSLSAALAVDVWLKDDGRYGTLYGGNKPRKLEFVLADARRRRARTILTTGGIGSNHSLATALYGRQLGFNVALALAYERPEPHAVANLLRMASAGAEIHYTRSYPLTALAAAWLAARCAWRDRRLPYVLGPGGSSPLAALGYLNAGLELADQVRSGELPEPSAIFLPLGTGGTAAGLLAGLRLGGLDSRVMAVAVTRAPTTWRAAVMHLARSTARLLARLAGDREIGRVRLDGLRVLAGWVGPGLGQPSAAGTEAMRRLEETEGIKLDPTYTAKTMAALLGLTESGTRSGPVLYWHTHNTIPLPEPSQDAAERLPISLRRLCAL